MDKIRCAFYIRVSTEEQVHHGLSLDAQLQALERWASGKAVEVVGVYEDPGISARKPASKRPALQRLLDDVRADRVDMIAFVKLDRWFRNVGEYYKVQEILDAHHVHWKAILEDYETATSSGRLKVNIMLSVAQDEADRTSERIRFVNEEKLARGELTQGKLPLGFKRGKNRRMEIDPDTADMARDICKTFIRSQSISYTRRYMLETYGYLNSYNHYRQMLSNRRYLGEDHGTKHCEALWSEEDFNLIQSILDCRSVRNSAYADRDAWNRHTYLFHGLCYCSECGKRMVTHTTKQGQYVYYRCQSYPLGICSHRQRMSEKKLEKYLLQNLLVGIDAYNISVRSYQAPAPVDTAPILRKLDKLKDLYLNDLIMRDAYEKEYKSLQADLDAAAVIPAPPEEIDASQIKDALAVYGSLTEQRKREFWSRTLSRITISPTGDVNFTPISP